MEILKGTVTSISGTSGTICDDKGNIYWFELQNCMGHKLPWIGKRVIFLKDTSFRSNNVADFVRAA